jgi:hypothetical protein
MSSRPDKVAPTAKTTGLWPAVPAICSKATLFHPRQEIWEEHFAAIVGEGTVIGLTPTGRATVDRLRMNTPTQRFARQQWQRLDLFP